jgi:hypothetical protein
LDARWRRRATRAGAVLDKNDTRKGNKEKDKCEKKRKIEGVRGEGGAWINLKTISTKSVAENVRSQTVETIVTPGYVQCILIVGKKKNLQ